MSEEMLRAAEAALERRRGRRRQTGRVRAQETSRRGTSDSMPSSWIREMLSIPLKRPLTGLQNFSQWSAFLAYILGGASMIVAPNLWRQIFNLNLSGHAAGYASLSGGGLVAIGFLYVICARSADPQVHGDGALLGTVIERLVYVNVALSMMVYALDLLPLPFALAFMVLDSTLALVSFLLWYRETEEASLIVFLRQITELLPPFHGRSRNASCLGVQMVGYTHISVGVFGTFCTDIVRDLLHLGHFQGHSHGLLALHFLTFTVIGWLHVLGGGCGNLAFSMSSVAYRFIWSVPLVLLFFARQQIQLSLALFHVLFDLISALLILILLGFEKSRAKSQ